MYLTEYWNDDDDDDDPITLPNLNDQLRLIQDLTKESEEGAKEENA